MSVATVATPTMRRDMTGILPEPPRQRLNFACGLPRGLSDDRDCVPRDRVRRDCSPGVGACGGGGGGGGGGTGSGSAADVARKLGRTPHFLVGMGNDLDNDHNQDGAYTLGVTLDLHYAYLVGLPGQGGWPDWNAGGTFVNILTDSADAHGVMPMFTLYAMASIGDGNRPGWRWIVHAAVLGGRACCSSGSPSSTSRRWSTSSLTSGLTCSSNRRRSRRGAGAGRSHGRPIAPDLPDNLVGLGRASCGSARMFAPKAVIGFHASQWAGAAGRHGFVPERHRRRSRPTSSRIDALDRDAGCFEAHVDPELPARRRHPGTGTRRNQTSPNFHEYLAWAKAIAGGTGKPILWWQVPFGVPSDTPGGNAGPLPRQPRAVHVQPHRRVRRGRRRGRRLRHRRRQPDVHHHRRRPVPERRDRLLRLARGPPVVVR